MKNLINKKHKHLLWKDELYGVPKSTKHTFLLLKYAEVFRYSKNVLRLIVWSPSKPAQLRKKGLILDEYKTGDNLYIIDAKVANLPQIIALGAHKRRVDLNGNWLAEKKEILGHDIIPFNPALEEKND